MIRKPVYFAVGFTMILLVIVCGLWFNGTHQTEIVTEVSDEQTYNYPIIEKVNNPNFTVMTYLTDDPKIKIVWLFED